MRQLRPVHTSYRLCFKTCLDCSVHVHCMLLLKMKSKWSHGHSVVPNMDEKL